MRILTALALLAGCAARVPQQPVVVTVAPLPEPPPTPAPAPPAAPPDPADLTAEHLADRCQVLAVDGEDGKPRPDLARVECEPPPGTAGPECLAGAVFAAAASGVTRDRPWFVYRISPAEQVPAGHFRIAVVYLDSAESYQRSRAANTDAGYVFATAEEVMPPEALLMQKSHRPADSVAAAAQSRSSLPDPFEEDENTSD
jgi:hypothetical protein